MDLDPNNEKKYNVNTDWNLHIPLFNHKVRAHLFMQRNEVLVSDSLLYTYEPDKKVFYDFEKIYAYNLESTLELNLELPEYHFLKTDIVEIIIGFSNSIAYSEFKIVTIIDLLS